MHNKIAYGGLAFKIGVLITAIGILVNVFYPKSVFGMATHIGFALIVVGVLYTRTPPENIKIEIVEKT